MYNLSKLQSWGEDIYIADNVVIKRPHLVSVGSHVAIDDFFYCTTQLQIGSHVHIAPMVSVIGGKDAFFSVGNFCTVAAGCRILCASDNFDGSGLVTAPGIPEDFLDGVSFLPIWMEDYSSLASNVVVDSGYVIGEGAVVGANSFVHSDIPPWEVWVGSPARKLKDRPREKMIEYARRLGYER